MTTRSVSLDESDEVRSWFFEHGLVPEDVIEFSVEFSGATAGCRPLLVVECLVRNDDGKPMMDNAHGDLVVETRRLLLRSWPDLIPDSGSK